LTTAQVVALIQDAPAVTVSAGGELLDMNLNVLADISDDLIGGQVSRNVYATLHGAATLAVARELDWGTAIIRPTLTMTDGTVTATFRLGAYFCDTPKRAVGDVPQVYDVTGYDILHGLGSPVGEAYAVAAGVGYLTTVEAILTANGYTRYVIDQQATAVTLPTARVWPLDDQTTWLGIVNDLLASIGYQGIWSDWDGVLHVQPYELPRLRAPEWTYDTGEHTSMIAPARTVERDLYLAPNRWVFHRTNGVDGPPPVEGSGVYTYVNATAGPTSVAARGGRVITTVVGVDVADQASLVARAQITIDADLRLRTSREVSTWPNPLHWHFDRLYLNDPAAGPPVDVLGTAWTLPLDGGAQTHSWSDLT
jgi:hypothetical protein